MPRRTLIGRILALLVLACPAWMLDGIIQPAQALPLLCSFSMSTVAFGAVDVLPGSAIASSGVLTVSCLNVAAGPGTLSVCVAFPTPRTMADPSSATLDWDLFGPAPATTSWSNTTPIAIPIASLLTGSLTITIPAGIIAGQSNRPPGSYVQTLTATATYGTSGCTGGLFTPVSFTFQATATVLKSCIVAASNLAFGTAGDLNVAVDGASQISVQCTATTPFTASLDGGLAGAADPLARRMTSGADSLTYGLYRNASRTLPWGSTMGTNTVGGTGTASPQNFAVFGRIPVQPTPTPGTYTDTIVVSITY